MYTVQRKTKNVCQVLVEHDGDFEQRFLLTADRHWDNPLSDHDMQKKHLRQARKYGAGVIDIGDFFCAMGGKFDKRTSKHDVRPEHNTANYFDSLVSTAADFFEEYARHFVLLGEGNHETKVQQKHEINLTDNLVRELNHRTGSSIYNGGYSGFVHFVFHDKRNNQRCHKKLWYMHGSGGGGPVTKGVIGSNRRAVYTPDADLVLTGHIHEEWQLTLVRLRCDNSSRVYQEEQVHAQLPTYKEEYQDGYGGFHVETGRPPKPLGGLWLKFYREDGDAVRFDLLRAK